MRTGKMKKKVILIGVVLLLIAYLIFNIVSYAGNETIYVNLTKADLNNIGYGVGNPTQSGGKYIWNLMQYNSNSASDISVPQRNLYCIKAEYGTTWQNSQKPEQIVEYNLSYDLQDEREKVLSNLVDNGTTDDIVKALLDPEGKAYRELLWILDNAYIPGTTDKIEYLEKAKIDTDWYIYTLTDADIKAVEQMAIWYFTNYQIDGNNVYNKTANIDWLQITTDGGTSYKTLSTLTHMQTEEGQERSEQAEDLYKYLVSSAKEGASNYTAENNYKIPTTSATVNVSGLTQENGKYKLNAEIKDTYNLIGPIVITGSVSSADDISMTLTNQDGTQIINYTLTDKNGNSLGKTLDKLVGNTSGFYIKVARNLATTVNISITTQTTQTTKTLWLSGTESNGKITLKGEQPIVEINREKIPTTIELTGTPEVIEIPVTKVWEDSNNQDGIRPTSVKVSLYANGTAVAGKTITLDSSNSWKGTFTDLPKTSGGVDIAYTVQEDETTGYATEVTGQGGSEFTITNTHIPETIDIPVTKVWSDSNNQDGKRPTSITVKLLANGVDVPGKTLTLNSSNLWKGTFEDLPVYESGKKINYTIEEVGVPAEYSVVTTGSSTEGFTVTNTYKPETIDIPVTKVWVDSNDQDKLRPPSIQVNLYANDVKVSGKTLTLNSGNSWKGTFTDLPKKSNGQDIIYTVKEDDVPTGYKVAISGTMTSGFTVTNTHKIFDLALRKSITQVNGENVTNTRLPDISEDSLKTGTTATYNHRKDPVKVSENDIVTYRIAIYNEGEKTGYASQIIDQLPTGLIYMPSSTVVSKDGKGANKNTYTVTYDPTTNKITFDIVNTEETPAKDLQAYKENNLDVEIIEIQCKVVAQADTTANKILTNVAWISGAYDTEDNTIAKDRDSQPENSPNVDKDNMEDYKGNTDNKDELDDDKYYYKGEQDDDDFEKLVIEPKISIPVTKVWEDSNNQDGTRPASITVSLLANGVKVPGKTLTLNSSNSWKGTFTDLPVYENETKITYTVEETGVPSGYETSTTGSATSGFTITNTYTPQTTQVSVEKVWEDSNNQDGKRPASITVKLLANGIDVPGKTLTLNSGNSWKGTFGDLPVYEDGTKITYTIEETGVPVDYESKTTGNATTGFIITNTYKPETIDIPVTKVWVDSNNQDKLRPPSVQVNLYANGEKVVGKTLTLNSGNSWKGTFTDLPKKSNGTDITYTVQEDDVPEGYKVAISGTMTSGFTVTNTHKIFDLALRKSITQVNGENVTNTRLPDISEDTLKTGTTATYNHRKDPVKVSENDIVTYRIAIYNEGEKTGYASQIIDQLPTGLVYVPNSTVVSKDSTGKDKNTYTVTYDPETNKITFNIVNTTDNPAKDLNAYKENNLDVEVIEIQCKVVAQADTSENKILTNVAWISGAYDTEDNTIAKDRDSQPENSPNVDKDNMEDYKGNTDNKDKLDDDEYYYKGEQDDDDFEKLVIEPIISIQVTKVWEDNNNQDGIRPTSITVALLADGKEVAGKTAILNEKNEWTYTFSGLPKNSNGKEIQYTVQETGVPQGYNSVITGNMSTGFVITNRYTPGKTTVKVTKVWDDNNNQDGIRPESVSVSLLANGKVVEGKTVDLSEKNNWEYVFTDLPEKENGEYIEYSVVENTVVDGYTTKITNNNNNNITSTPGQTASTLAPTYTITNTHETDLTSVTVNKVWVDENNIDKIRPDSVTVRLLANGEVVSGKTIELSEENGWTYTFEDLPKYEEGETINYTIEEVQVPPGYTSETTGTMETGYTITNTHIPEKNFDLALRKYIIELNGTKLTELGLNSRVPNISEDSLKTGTTATYKHRKDPVEVVEGDIVTYAITIYNEGEKAGYATQIIDQLPTGLIYNPSSTVVSVDSTGANKNTYTVTYDPTTNKITFDIVNTNENPAKDLNAYEPGKLDSETIILKCKVTYKAKAGEKNILTNVAWINIEYNSEDQKEITSTVGEDRDSEPSNSPSTSSTNVNKDNMEDYKGNTNNKDDLTDSNYFYEGEQDDDDFEKLYVKTFDLSLRKFITGVNGKDLKDENGNYLREPVVDVTPLVNGTDSTAIYNHPKTPVALKIGDKVTYTIRVYNEGEIDGYATIVSDYLPPYLIFVEDSKINEEYGWEVSEDGRVVTTSYLSDKEISAFNGTELDYKDLKIECQISPEAVVHQNITNIAEITEDDNEYDVPDRDSTPDDIDEDLPEDEDLPKYKDEESDKPYVPGNEDDDDFEKVYVKEFDLALRKFITQVQDTAVTTRVPQVKYEDGQITYEHTKEPLIVHVDDVVIYTLRIYNEGELDGYASEIRDDIPEYLEFLPENSTNVEYKWKMYDENDEETTDVSKAVSVKTDYLSKENGEDNLIKAFDGTTLYYKDIKIAFKVKDPNSNEYIITNYAQISDDEDEEGNPVEDKDSTPDEWNEGEDDQDIEHVKVEYFDLSLLKFVTKVIVIEDGQEKITETGYNGHEDPEPVVKVELYRKNLKNVVVKFGFGITITNEGDIAGYANEITDYVPEGLRFEAADNPEWTDEGNNVISTRQLEGTLLQPGESATVEVILTWNNGEDNLAEKTNTAEISEDDNEYDVPDRDSTPDNQKEGEDDIDIAKVILTISTGAGRTYFTLTLGLLSIVLVGIILIKKFVL